MFKSPLVLPLTLIFAGVLAFMATTGVLPPAVMRFWPVIFVILGLIGLVSLSSDDLMDTPKSARKSAPAAKSAAPAKKAKKKTPARKKS